MAVPETIASGATGSVVRWAQYLLVRRTLSYQQIDGIFGPVTKAAVEHSRLTVIWTSTGSWGLPPGLRLEASVHNLLPLPKEPTARSSRSCRLPLTRGAASLRLAPIRSDVPHISRGIFR